ncbi:MAG: hypothetical protein ABWX96_10755 [Propionibacteriaceae bacterium]
MTMNLDAAEQFVLTHGRLLERIRLAVLLHDADRDGLLVALSAYQNPDGGFGQALEPDVRGPHSETTSTLDALEQLLDQDAAEHPAVAEALAWVGTEALPDGGVPFVLPATADYPHAPWMQPSDGGSHLTFGFAAVGRRVKSDQSWLDGAESWSWNLLAHPERIDGYLLKYALKFLDAHGDDPRTPGILDQLKGLVGPDGSVPVPGGIEDEKLTPLTLSPRPDLPSRTLFTADQIQADLDELEAGQQADGGWTFNFAEWCPAQGLDWRGLVTVQALTTLREHGRS